MAKILPNSIDKEISKYENEKTENIQFNLEINNCHQKIIEEYEQKNIETNLIPPSTNLEFIDSKKSSDSTSYISIYQNENLSQTSDSSLFNSHPLNSKLIIKKDFSSLKDKEEINYFYDIENYFNKIMPEKFIEYKKTRNYLPKKEICIKPDEEKEIIQKDMDIKKEYIKNLQFNHEQIHEKNNSYYPIPQYSFFYNYNILYFNYPFRQIHNNAPNQQINKEKEEKEDIEESKESIKQEEDNYKYNNNESNKEKIKLEYKDFFNNDNIYDDENDVNIYIIEKVPNYKKYNKKNFKEKINNKMFNEKINKVLYYNKNYCNCSNKNYSKKYYKSNNNQIKNSYYNLNNNNHEQKRSYYNYNNYNKRRPIKIIYY